MGECHARSGEAHVRDDDFGEFFVDQVGNASCVVLSHTAGISEDKLHACLEALKEVNPSANYVTAEWDKLDGKTILSAMEKKDSLDAELKKLAEDYEHEHEHAHEHHHHDDDDDDDDEEETPAEQPAETAEAPAAEPVADAE